MSFPYLTGFESTYLPNADVDILELTGHLRHWKEDLRRVKDCGLRSLRYPAPWHRIARERGRYDWTWMDDVMGYLREMELDPVIDLIHHTSFPAWLDQGLANPDFSDAEVDFALAFAERYPWVRRYTPFNEPFLTSFMCGSQGVWYPRSESPDVFARMLVNVGRAVCAVGEALRSDGKDVEIIHIDTCEHHQSVDPSADSFVQFVNERRFLMHDLVLGRIDDHHPLYPFLSKHGVSDVELRWFQDHATQIDVLGLDYYAHSEYQFDARGSIVPSRSPRGFAEVARDYAERYDLPIMLSETNIRGFVLDRLSWLKYMAEQCEKLDGEGVDFRGFCWFPFIDSTDWDSLLREANGHVDPVGLYWLDSDREERHWSVLVHYFRLLARGEITSDDLPAYRFQPPLDDQLQGFFPQMAHWSWQPTPQGPGAWETEIER